MFSTAFVDGLVLAATVQEDRRLTSVGPGLAPGLERALADRLAKLAALSREARHREIRRLVRQRIAVPTNADLPPRAALILAGDVPREIGRRWAARASEVRRGYQVPHSLRSALRRLAQPSSANAAAEERAAAPRADALPPSRRARVLAIAAHHGERALGALVLGIEGREGGDPTSRKLRRIGRELALIWESPWRV